MPFENLVHIESNLNTAFLNPNLDALGKNSNLTSTQNWSKFKTKFEQFEESKIFRKGHWHWPYARDLQK